MTDYEDDLGRTRRVPRSEVPREARRAKQVAQEDEVNEECVLGARRMAIERECAKLALS